jgi:hypothetical protein
MAADELVLATQGGDLTFRADTDVGVLFQEQMEPNPSNL